MRKNKQKTNVPGKVILLSLIVLLVLTGCSGSDINESTDSADNTTTNTPITTLIDTSDIFTDRDLRQNADLDDAVYLTLESEKDVTIDEEGVYVISGEASDVTIYVDVSDDEKVQIVLDAVVITNADKACIYVENADKVFITTSVDSTLIVTDEFADSSARAVIYSRDDLVLNGTAALTISSSEIGVKANDDLKITGGSYNVESGTVGFRANDSIAVYDGEITIKAGTDGLHAENSDDDTDGYIYIAGGTFDIEVGDDGIHAITFVQIDGGTFTIDAYEGIEATYLQINDGTIDIYASDDGLNGANKSSGYSATIEITGGNITIVTADGDTDAVDSNGDLIISGGTINITADSAFDFDGSVSFTGGTVYVNGQQVTNITANSMPGHGGKGYQL